MATQDYKIPLLVHSFFWLGLAIGSLVSSARIGEPHTPIEILSLSFLFLGISFCQYVLLQIMHEAIHQSFQKNHPIKSVLMASLVAFPIGLTRKYSFLHLDHHRFFGDPERDPDFPNFGRFPQSKLEFVTHSLLHLTSWTAFQQILFWRKAPSHQQKGAYRYDVLGILVSQAFLLLICYLMGAWWMYLTHWAFPLVTVVKLLGYLRILSEHGDLHKGAVLRSFHGSPNLSSVLGPYGLQFHAEHHLLPAIPYQALHSEISSQVKRPMEFEIYQGSHIGFLFNTFQNLPLKKPKAVS